MLNDPCVNCGLCCKKMIIEIRQEDVDREPRLLPVVKPLIGIQDYQEYGLAWGGSYPCPMLDENNRCQIYATRPNCCKDFEVGSEKCNELRSENGLPVIEVAT